MHNSWPRLFSGGCTKSGVAAPDNRVHQGRRPSAVCVGELVPNMRRGRVEPRRTPEYARPRCLLNCFIQSRAQLHLSFARGRSHRPSAGRLHHPRQDLYAFVHEIVGELPCSPSVSIVQSAGDGSNPSRSRQVVHSASVECSGIRRFAQGHLPPASVPPRSSS